MRIGLGGITGTRILSVGLGTVVSVGEVCTPVDQIDGAVAEGAAFTHPADGVVAFDVDALPSVAGVSNLWVNFRSLGHNHTWHISITDAGVLYLYERVGGTSTPRGAAIGVIASGDRVVVVMDSTTIRVYESKTLRITYSGATRYADLTAGDARYVRNGAAISDLKIWTLACRGEEGI